MLIRHSKLTFQLSQPFPAMYILIGQEFFQLNYQAKIIKSQWCHYNSLDVDTKILYINAASDWLIVEQQANNYALFSNTTFIDVYYEKKTMDTVGKDTLFRYVQRVNSNTLLLIRAPYLPLKQLQIFLDIPNVQVILFSPPDKSTVIQWITEQLNKIGKYDNEQIPALIYQYHEGNMQASAQLLKKLAIVVEPGKAITLDDVQNQLVNQCNFPLFSLADSCLLDLPVTVVQLLRQAHSNGIEATLILWILTQEIRFLMQLVPASKQSFQTFRELAAQLKIGASRIKLYQSAMKRYDYALLVSLLRFCRQLDEQIKINQSNLVWQSFELIALSLCYGKQVGYFA